MKILQNLSIFLVLFVLMLADAVAKTPDPYKVLGISRSATEDDIKKAFNKRSKQYHPDRNKQDPRAKQKFEKVVNAYELLKDSQRRKIYDMTGSDDPNTAGMGNGFANFGGFRGFRTHGGDAADFGINIQDLLNMGFGGFGGFGGQRQGTSGQGRARTYTFTFGGAGQTRGFKFQM